MTALNNGKSVKIINLDRTNPTYPPPKITLLTAEKFLNKLNFTNYSEPEGLLELRKALSLKLKNVNCATISPDQIVVTAGSSLAIQLALLLGSKKNGAVLCPNPSYPPYLKTLKYLKKKVIFYKENKLEEIKSVISNNKISLCVVNTPSNPTGSVFIEDDLRELVVLSRKNKFYLLSDEAYENYSYESKHVSPTAFDTKGTVFSTFSFSKTYSMSGWRVGYLVLPISFIQEARSLYRAMAINTSILSQISALAALTDLSFPGKIHDYYLYQRDYLVNLLTENDIFYVIPQGGLSFWINIAKTRLSSESFANQCIENARTIIQAGTQFGSNGESFIRASFSGMDTEVFEGFNRLINFYKKQTK